MRPIWHRSISMLLKQQTNILSAAVVIMATSLLSLLLGVVKYRLLASIFGASNTSGVFLASSQLPDLIFQSVIAAAFASAFIPVFSDYLAKQKEKEAHTMASTLLFLSIIIFFVFSVILFIFAPYFLQIINPGNGFTPAQMALMANLMRIILFGQLLFIVGTFYTSLLQSYNHFLIPGFALALYNLGTIIGILALHNAIGIYSAAAGVILGATFYILVQIPLIRKVGFRFQPQFTFRNAGVITISKLMWPRTISLAIFRLGSIMTVALVSFLPNAGRNFLLFDYAQTLAFAPVTLFGQTLAQAALPVLAREKDKPEDFKVTFMSTFTQMLYIVLPVSALILVLRIPIVRIVYGASKLDWEATVLIGRTLAWFSFSIFAQALIALVARGFYALHNTKIPLVVNGIATLIMLLLSYAFITYYHFGIQGLAAAYSLVSIIQLLIMLILLDKKIGGFKKIPLTISLLKLFFAALFTTFALYIPIKLLDQLVFDTTKTVNLLILTGISSLAGLSLYLFLTWLFNVEEAHAFVLMFKKTGNWREILRKSDEPIDGTRRNP